MMAKKKLLQGLLPLGFFVTLFIFSGLGLTVFQSFGWFVPGGESYTGARAFHLIVSDQNLLMSLGYSLYIALVSSLFSLVLGLVLAFSLWGLNPKNRFLGGIYKIPVVMPHFTVAFIIIFFWSASGFFSSFLHPILGNGSQKFMGDLYYSSWGFPMILAYTYKQAPFIALMCLGVLDQTDKRLVTTAQMLGATGLQSYILVILPLLKPILMASFSIIFLYAFGAFEIPFLLGISFPEMISQGAYRLYSSSDLYRRAEAMAFLVMIALLVLLFLVFYFKVVGKKGYRGRKI